MTHRHDQYASIWGQYPTRLSRQITCGAAGPQDRQTRSAENGGLLASHPEAVQARKIIQSHPASSGFENSTFYGLNAFWFMDASGRSIPVRWSLAPVQPFAPAGTAGPAQADKNYLFDALIAGILQQTLQWHLIITIGQANDPTDDATIPWPDAREQVDVGTLTLDHVESEETSPCRDINFDPLVLPEGITSSPYFLIT
jgi:catalase